MGPRTLQARLARLGYKKAVDLPKIITVRPAQSMEPDGCQIFSCTAMNQWTSW